MFRAAVKSAGVESEQRPIEPDAERAKPLAGALARVDRQADAGTRGAFIAASSAV
jgi:hypothetical protein